MTLKHAQPAGYSAFARSAVDNASILAKAQGFFSSTIQRLNQQAEVRQAVWELQQLDDHALRDIGLSRCDIEAQVLGHRK